MGEIKNKVMYSHSEKRRNSFGNYKSKIFCVLMSFLIALFGISSFFGIRTVASSGDVEEISGACARNVDFSCESVEDTNENSVRLNEIMIFCLILMGGSLGMVILNMKLNSKTNEECSEKDI